MNADEMFEKLGYDIKKDDGKVISFEKSSSSSMWDKPAIIFDKISKLIIFYDIDCLSMRTLQAINKKCEELGWFNSNEGTMSIVEVDLAVKINELIKAVKQLDKKVNSIEQK